MIFARDKFLKKKEEGGLLIPDFGFYSLLFIKKKK